MLGLSAVHHLPTPASTVVIHPVRAAVDDWTSITAPDLSPYSGGMYPVRTFTLPMLAASAAMPNRLSGRGSSHRDAVLDIQEPVIDTAHVEKAVILAGKPWQCRERLLHGSTRQSCRHLAQGFTADGDAGCDRRRLPLPLAR